MILTIVKCCASIEKDPTLDVGCNFLPQAWDPFFGDAYLAGTGGQQKRIVRNDENSMRRCPGIDLSFMILTRSSVLKENFAGGYVSHSQIIDCRPDSYQYWWCSSSGNTNWIAILKFTFTFRRQWNLTGDALKYHWSKNEFIHSMISLTSKGTLSVNSS